MRLSQLPKVSQLKRGRTNSRAQAGLAPESMPLTITSPQVFSPVTPGWDSCCSPTPIDRPNLPHIFKLKITQLFARVRGVSSQKEVCFTSSIWDLAALGPSSPFVG